MSEWVQCPVCKEMMENMTQCANCAQVRGPKERLVWHRSHGEVYITEACDYLQAGNPDPTSMFVDHQGEIIEVSKNMVKEGEPWFNRASGDVICQACGKKYYDHPKYMKALSCIDGSPVLNQLCDGSLVKL